MIDELIYKFVYNYIMFITCSDSVILLPIPKVGHIF